MKVVGNAVDHQERKKDTHESSMRHRRPGAVQPRLLIQMPRGHKRRRCHLLRIQPKSHISRAVLALRDSSWHGFGLVGIVEAGQVLVGVIFARAEGRDGAVLLRFGPVEDLLVFFWIPGWGRHGGKDVSDGRKQVRMDEGKAESSYIFGVRCLWLHTADTLPVWGMWGALAAFGRSSGY